MDQVAAWMEAGDLANGLGQGIGQAVGRVRGQGEQTWPELADVPGGAVAAAGAGSVRGAKSIQDDGEAGSCDAGPVLSASPAPLSPVVRLPRRSGRGPSVAPGGPGNDESAADGGSATL
jgi:hypothetical protein